jgi:uncharacterized protein YjbI with pentapeptide repeats
VDLRGYQAPPPRRLREFQLRGLVFAELAGLVEVVGVTWRSLDLSGANLEHLRVKDARVEDCRLDQAGCLGLRIWRSAIADSTFIKADLRHKITEDRGRPVPGRLHRAEFQVDGWHDARSAR